MQADIGSAVAVGLFDRYFSNNKPSFCSYGYTATKHTKNAESVLFGGWNYLFTLIFYLYERIGISAVASPMVISGTRATISAFEFMINVGP